MDKIQSKQNNRHSRNKRTELKNQLSSLASTAKNSLNQNQTLTELISIKRKQIFDNKESLSKLSLLNSTTKSKIELNNKLINKIKSNNLELLSKNNSLREQINNLNNKYVSLSNTLAENNAEIVNQLNILKDREFIYENAIKEKESIIRRLKMNLFEYYLQSYNIEHTIDIFNEDQSLDSDDEFSKTVNDYRDILLKVSICYNKNKNIKIKLKKQITELKTHIKKIKRYINTLKNLIANFDCLDIHSCCNKIKIEDEECIEEKKEVINDNNDIKNNIFTFTDESDFNETNNIETDEDLEICHIIENPIFKEETKINNKDTFPPKIDLTMINYNKMQKKLEDKEKSLSREKMYEKDIISLRINKLKNDIKMYEEKKEILIEKKKSFKQKIIEMRRKIKILNESITFSFPIKSVKRRKFNFNSSAIIYNNNSLSKNTNKFDSSGIDHLNNMNMKSYYSNRYI